MLDYICLYGDNKINCYKNTFYIFMDLLQRLKYRQNICYKDLSIIKLNPTDFKRRFFEIVAL